MVLGSSRAIVKLRSLRIGYEIEDEILWVVDSIDLDIPYNTIYCLVGESGCGKTTIGSAIAGLLPPYAVLEGYLEIDGKKVVDGIHTNYEGIRGKVVTRIPQDPATSLNPFLTIGEQLEDVLRIHFGIKGSKARERAIKLLNLVKLPIDVLDRYPHELSGGMKQRAAIALALAPQPKIIVADEPTSNLDAYLKGLIASLLRSLRNVLKLTIVLITHDIAIASTICDYIAVVYAGKVVEHGPKDLVVKNPLHPYTKLLLKVVPSLGSKERLTPIPGTPPEPGKYPSGCRFRLRCPWYLNECITEPILTEVEPNHFVACWRYAMK